MLQNNKLHPRIAIQLRHSFFLILIFLSFTFLKAQSNDYPKIISGYSLKAVQIPGVIGGIILHPNDGLYIANGNSLKLYDGSKVIEIPFAKDMDTLGSGLINCFRRTTKNGIYLETQNYIYRIDKQITPIYNIHKKSFFFSGFQNNQLARKGSFQINMQNDELVSLIQKKKSGIIISHNSPKFYNNALKKVFSIREYKGKLVDFYIRKNQNWYVYSEDIIYQITQKGDNYPVVKEIKDPLPMLKTGNVFERNGNCFSLNPKGFFYINIQGNKWHAEKLLDSNQVRDFLGTHIMEVTEDLRNIFFTTSDQKLLHFSKKQIQPIFGNSSNTILANKSKYITNGNFDFDFTKNLKSKNGFLDAYGSDYYLHSNAKFYFTYYDSLFSINNNLVKEFIISNPRIHWNRFAEYKGYLIAAAYGKVFSINKFGVFDFPIKNENGKNLFKYCYSIKIKDELIYLGTDFGIFVYDLKNQTLQPIADLPYREVRCLAFDEKTKSLIAFTYGHGPFLLIGKQGYKLPLDPDKNLLFAHHFVRVKNLSFIPTNNGLYIVPFEDWINSNPQNKVNFFRLDEQDGLPSNECNSGSEHSILKDTSRMQLAFCTIKGLGILPFNQFEPFWPNIAPKISIANYNNIKRFGCPDTIFNYKNLHFEVTVPFFGNPENLRVEYRISGIYDLWTPLKNHQIYLPDNLYGNKTIELRVNSGFKNYITNKYIIYFYPKWHQSTTFKYFVIFLILIFIAGIVFINKSIEFRKRQKLMKLVDERTFELNQALSNTISLNKELQNAEIIKENLVSVLAHDMRSPLMSIIFCIDTLIKDENSSENKSSNIELLKEIKISLSNLTQFSNEFLRWYTLYRGGYRINKQLCSINDLIANIINFYDPIIQRDGHQLILYNLQDYSVLVDPEIFKIVFRNLLDNANKYCYEKIEIESLKVSTKISLIIKNDYQSELEFPLRELQEKLLQTDPLAKLDEQFKFGLGIISQMARVSDIVISLSFDHGIVTFKLDIPCLEQNSQFSN